MPRKANHAELVDFWTARTRQLLQERNNLSQDDLEYTVQKIYALRDERLKAAVIELIGWGDDQRAEIETFCAIALEVMKDSTPSRLREAARRVELRVLARDLQRKQGAGE